MATVIGIAKKHQGKIFDKLYQIAATTIRKYRGTDMEVAVSKDIIEAHGGMIYGPRASLANGISLPSQYL